MKNINSDEKTNKISNLEHRANTLRYAMLYYSNLKSIKTNIQMFIMDEG